MADRTTTCSWIYLRLNFGFFLNALFNIFLFLKSTVSSPNINTAPVFWWKGWFVEVMLWLINNRSYLNGVQEWRYANNEPGKKKWDIPLLLNIHSVILGGAASSHSVSGSLWKTCASFPLAKKLSPRQVFAEQLGNTEYFVCKNESLPSFPFCRRKC